MATWTKADLSKKSMQFIEALAAGQSPAAEDDILTQKIIDSVHDQLRKVGLAPFVTSAIPMWAQQPMTKIVAGEIAPYFGISGQQLAEIRQAASMGERELGKQISADRRRVPIKANYF